MTVSVSALGAIVALVVAIGLILRKVPPVYGMMVGALVGGLVGGADFGANRYPDDRRRKRYHHRRNANFGGGRVGRRVD